MLQKLMTWAIEEAIAYVAERIHHVWSRTRNIRPNPTLVLADFLFMSPSIPHDDPIGEEKKITPQLDSTNNTFNPSWMKRLALWHNHFCLRDSEPLSFSKFDSQSPHQIEHKLEFNDSVKKWLSHPLPIHQYGCALFSANWMDRLFHQRIMKLVFAHYDQFYIFLKRVSSIPLQDFLQLFYTFYTQGVQKLSPLIYGDCKILQAHLSDYNCCEQCGQMLNNKKTKFCNPYNTPDATDYMYISIRPLLDTRLFIYHAYSFLDIASLDTIRVVDCLVVCGFSCIQKVQQWVERINAMVLYPWLSSGREHDVLSMFETFAAKNTDHLRNQRRILRLRTFKEWQKTQNNDKVMDPQVMSQLHKQLSSFVNLMPLQRIVIEYLLWNPYGLNFAFGDYESNMLLS